MGARVVNPSINLASYPWPRQRPSPNPRLAERPDGPVTVPVLLPLALPAPYDYLVPKGMAVEPGQFVVVPLGPGRLSRRGVAAPRGRAAAGHRPQEVARDHRAGRRRAEAAARLARLRRLGGELHPLLSRHGAAHDDERGPRFRSAGAALRRAVWQGRRPARMTPARARVLDAAEQRADLGQVEPGRGGRRQPRRDRRPGRCRRAGHRAPARLARHADGFVARAGQAHQRARPGRARPARKHRRWLQREPARRRHRLGQDRSLFRGDRRGAGARQAGAGADARDRADQSVHYPLRAALRRPPRRMAFRRIGASARPGLARGGGKQGEAGGRRPLGSVPALPRSRPDRGR